MFHQQHSCFDRAGGHQRLPINRFGHERASSNPLIPLRTLPWSAGSEYPSLVTRNGIRLHLDNDRRAFCAHRTSPSLTQPHLAMSDNAIGSDTLSAQVLTCISLYLPLNTNSGELIFLMLTEAASPQGLRTDAPIDRALIYQSLIYQALINRLG